MTGLFLKTFKNASWSVAEDFHSVLVSDEAQRHTALCSRHNSKHVWKPKNCELYTLIFSLSYFLMTFFWAATLLKAKETWSPGRVRERNPHWSSLQTEAPDLFLRTTTFMKSWWDAFKLTHSENQTFVSSPFRMFSYLA